MIWHGPGVDAQTIDAAARLLETAALVAAAALGTWFVVGTGACVAARSAPHLRIAQAAARWAPAVVRRCAGVACSASVVLAPQVAHAAERPVPPAAVVADEPVVRAPMAPAAPPVIPAAPADPAAAAEPAAPVEAAARTHVVAAGENLWQIARAELGGDPGRAEIAAYWRLVVDANLSTLRSGNPNLIYPGEAVTLPPATG